MDIRSEEQNTDWGGMVARPDRAVHKWEGLSGALDSHVIPKDNFLVLI